MKIKDIEFKEQYLYEKPSGNYWRGITAYIGGIRLLDIRLDNSTLNGDTLGINLGGGVIPYILWPAGGERIDMANYEDQEDQDTGLGALRFKLEDKELVKARALEIIERYFSLFVE